MFSHDILIKKIETTHGNSEKIGYVHFVMKKRKIYIIILGVSFYTFVLEGYFTWKRTDKN